MTTSFFLHIFWLNLIFDLYESKCQSLHIQQLKKNFHLLIFMQWIYFITARIVFIAVLFPVLLLTVFHSVIKFLIFEILLFLLFFFIKKKKKMKKRERWKVRVESKRKKKINFHEFCFSLSFSFFNQKDSFESF